jgi:hypothetical protein
MHNTVTDQSTTKERTARRNSKGVDAGHRRDSLTTHATNIIESSPNIHPRRATSPSITTSSRTLVESESEGEWDSNGRVPGPITPDVIAKYYLPQIFRRVNGLVSGQVSVKDILKHLREHPHFNQLDNQTCRRRVTAALENSNAGVKYNKVKWGVWEALPLDKEFEDEGKPAHVSAKRSRPSPLTIPPTRSKKLSPAPLSLSSNAIESDSEDEADKMSLDGEPEIRVTRVRRHIRQFTPDAAEDDSEATEEEDWFNDGPSREASSSYAASYSSRRGSYASIGTRASLAPTAAGAVDIARGMSHRRNSSGRSSFPKQRYLSLPNGATFSHEFGRSMTYSGGCVPFEALYSKSVERAARDQKKMKVQKHRHHENRYKYSMEGVNDLSLHPFNQAAARHGSVQPSGTTISDAQPINHTVNDIEAAQALIGLCGLSPSPLTEAEPTYS